MIVGAKEELDKFIDKLGEDGFNPEIRSLYWWAVRPGSAVERAARLTVVYTGVIINGQHYMPATADCCGNFRKVRNAAKRWKIADNCYKEHDYAGWPVTTEFLSVKGEKRNDLF